MVSVVSVFLLVCFVFKGQAWFRQCYCKATSYYDDGRGHLVLLGMHNPQCEGQGMTRFHLDRGAWQTYRYEYRCCNIPKSARSYSIHTNYTYSGEGNVTYLVNQTVDCGPDSLLSGFHLTKHENCDHVRYNVTCHRFPYHPYPCYEAFTDFKSDKEGDTRYLDQHNVECRVGTFLNRFQLVRRGTDEISYRYKCCQPDVYGREMRSELYIE